MLRSALGPVLPALIVLAAQPGGAQETPKLAPVGLRKQLVVDDFVIAEAKGVTREPGQAVKQNGGRPIFPDCWWAASVHHDGGVFKMWYLPKNQKFTWEQEQLWTGAYAESKDGLHWVRKGDLSGWKPYGPLLVDPHETDPAHKFKSAMSFPASGWSRAGLMHSGDGLRWSAYNEGKPVTGPAADFTNQILWDAEANRYLLITREMPLPTDYKGMKRGVRIMSNPDVKANPTNWTTLCKLKVDPEGEWRRRQIYHFTDWMYEGVHFGLMAVYEWPGDLREGDWDGRKRHERDVQNCYVATSRDAVRWDMGSVYEEKTLIPRGPDGSFDKDAVYICPTLVTHQDKHWLYYSGAKERHDMAYNQTGAKTGDDDARIRDMFSTGLATLRLDGFAGLQGKDPAGTVLTRPFLLEGTGLEVNVDAKEGEVAVEVVDPSAGTPFLGFARSDAEPLRSADVVRLRPRWKDSPDVSSLKGKAVQLRFHLRNAKLYAFQVKP